MHEVEEALSCGDPEPRGPELLRGARAREVEGPVRGVLRSACAAKHDRCIVVHIHGSEQNMLARIGHDLGKELWEPAAKDIVNCRTDPMLDAVTIAAPPPNPIPGEFVPPFERPRPFTAPETIRPTPEPLALARGLVVVREGGNSGRTL